MDCSKMEQTRKTLFDNRSINLCIMLKCNFTPARQPTPMTLQTTVVAGMMESIDRSVVFCLSVPCSVLDGTVMMIIISNVTNVGCMAAAVWEWSFSFFLECIKN